MSDSLGIENFSGSDSTSGFRQSFGKPKPMTSPSFENARKTIWPTRYLIRPRTNASYARGSVCANSRTSSTVTGTFVRLRARLAHALRESVRRRLRACLLEQHERTLCARLRRPVAPGDGVRVRLLEGCDRRLQL